MDDPFLILCWTPMERQHRLFAYHQDRKQQIASMTRHWKEEWQKKQDTHLRRKQISHRHQVISLSSQENAAKSNSKKLRTPSPPPPSVRPLSISSENSQRILPRTQGDEYGAPKAPIILTYSKSVATSDQDHSLRSRPAPGRACTGYDADQSGGVKEG